MGPDVLAVFVKRPRAGEVKTRLASALGDEAAAELYRVLAEEVLRRTAPGPGDYDRVLYFAPPDAGEEMQEWLPGEAWRPQADGDLGERMAHAFEEMFRRGARRVVLIGSDAPALSRAVVRAALGALDDRDVVLGPAPDGGYFLVGLASPCPALFAGIPWSTPSVLATTLERATLLGLRVRRLESLRDIDTLDDLREEWSHLRPLCQPRPGLMAAAERALGRR